MIVDGRAIAEHMLATLGEYIAKAGYTPHLGVVTCAPNFETQKFLALKKRKAEDIGIVMNVVELLPDATTEECVTTITELAAQSDGVVVQLPFPPHVDRDALTVAIPQEKDVDAFVIEEDEVLPPVVGAMKEILARHDVSVRGKRVVVVGRGMLVGAPAEQWFKKEGAHVTVVTKETQDMSAHTKEADVVVLGAGVPALLKPNMVKEGVIILDAGTSEEGGELRGDADPACAEKASLFTPVPGGIGPITVAILLKNLLTLTKRHQAESSQKTA